MVVPREWSLLKKNAVSSLLNGLHPNSRRGERDLVLLTGLRDILEDRRTNLAPVSHIFDTLTSFEKDPREHVPTFLIPQGTNDGFRGVWKNMGTILDRLPQNLTGAIQILIVVHFKIYAALH